MNYTVYIIRSEEGFTYIGYTEDLEKRLEEHTIEIFLFGQNEGKIGN